MNEIFKDLSPASKRKKKIAHLLTLSLLEFKHPEAVLFSTVLDQRGHESWAPQILINQSLAFNTGINNHTGHGFSVSETTLYKMILYGMLYKLASSR